MKGQNRVTPPYERAKRRFLGRNATSEQRAALLQGMEGATTVGTAKTLSARNAPYYVPGLRIAEHDNINALRMLG